MIFSGGEKELGRRGVIAVCTKYDVIFKCCKLIPVLVGGILIQVKHDGDYNDCDDDRDDDNN